MSLARNLARRQEAAAAPPAPAGPQVHPHADKIELRALNQKTGEWHHRGIFDTEEEAWASVDAMVQPPDLEADLSELPEARRELFKQQAAKALANDPEHLAGLRKDLRSHFQVGLVRPFGAVYNGNLAETFETADALPLHVERHLAASEKRLIVRAVRRLGPAAVEKARSDIRAGWKLMLMRKPPPAPEAEPQAVEEAPPPQEAPTAELPKMETIEPPSEPEAPKALEAPEHPEATPGFPHGEPSGEGAAQ